MASQIVHLDIPDFHAALEELRHPEFRGHPLVLSEQSPRAVIQGVNATARKEGLREGMPLAYAKRLCRKLMTLPPDHAFYRKERQGVLEELDRFSPLVEGTSQGRYFVDLTGSRRLWGPASDAACRIEKELEERRGLRARVGLASNKLVSQVAARCVAPGDLGCVFVGGESSFLAPLPVDFLPGVGAKTASRLADFNIQWISQLASIPTRMLSEVFGSAAVRLVKMAQGDDPTQVIPFQKVPKLSLEHRLDRDEIDRERVEAVLFQQVEEAGWMLRRHNEIPGKLGLEIHYADGAVAGNQLSLPPLTFPTDRSLFHVALSLFRKLFQRRVAIRSLVLEFSDFSAPFRQMPLFPWEKTAAPGCNQNLQRALDGIRERYGRTSVAWGLTLLAGSSPKATLRTP